jgi:hypothetical protein
MPSRCYLLLSMISYYGDLIRVSLSEKNNMIRANIKNPEGVYIGLIGEDNDLFKIVWNSNMDNYAEYNRFASDERFQTFEEACQGVYKVSQDVKISETIFFKPKPK